MAGHVPVLLKEVLEALPPLKNTSVVVDMTFGGGGYTKAILENFPCAVVGLDRDPEAIGRGQSLVCSFAGRLRLVQTPFSQLESALGGCDLPAGGNEGAASANGVGGVFPEVVDAVIFDLGVSSFQLDVPERGFSFRENGPLDMRMSRDGLSAADVVATYTQEQLADIFWRYGEEKLARKMAEAIVVARAEKPIAETKHLVEVLHRVRARRHNDRTDPATKVFQALRIEVNQELEEIRTALEKACALLRPGGVVVVVTFHSLEDRLVKRIFRTLAGPATHVNKYREQAAAGQAGEAFVLQTRKAIVPQREEVKQNPRARSAKMRILKKATRGVEYAVVV